MILFINTATSPLLHARVTPDEEQAEALRRKREALNYTPQSGFHKDRTQDRLPARFSRLAQTA